ncbi:nuclear transport factor 2 family protein [Mesorhizobium sp. M1378]|uniref:YybH family protein n=1 Tax=Mesorhizobium sp. M1378 TaxID=2957092 RepID=UPI00333BC967
MAIREELQDLYDRYAAAYTAGDASTCAAVFAPNGELFSPYAPPARGREAIEALHKVWTRNPVGNKQLIVLDAGASGDVAWCLATYSEGLPTGDGTSLNVLERQPDGSWLIRVCSLNSSDPDH